MFYNSFMFNERGKEKHKKKKTEAKKKKKKKKKQKKNNKTKQKNWGCRTGKKTCLNSLILREQVMKYT